MVRWYETKTKIEPTWVQKIAKRPLIEEKDKTVAWLKSKKVNYLGYDERHRLHVIESRTNGHRYYFLDEEMNEWFED